MTAALMPNHLLRAVDKGIEDVRLMKPLQHLTVCACAAWIIEERSQVVDLATSIQIVEHVIDKIEQFMNRVPHGHATMVHEIDHFCIQAIPCCTPFILFNKV
jgi:hypothetical protein